MTYCIGVDFGTDSVRALLVNVENGGEMASSVFDYPRWKKGLYCNPEAFQFRQHPLDYIEGLEYTIKDIINQVPGSSNRVCAISIDTTGSTPVAVNKQGTPLALLPEFKDNPDAMFMLWKDHSAMEEADMINALCQSWPIDYLRFSGGTYSAEWFWSKVLYVLRRNEEVANAAYSWVEHCDWIPALLVGETNPLQIKRSRSAAGHKAMWHQEWNGLPSSQFLKSLHPRMEVLKPNLYKDTFTSDIKAGTLSKVWAEKFGLPDSLAIGVGALDSHFGFVGGQIEPNKLCKVIGTSTVDMVIVPSHKVGNDPIQGICGQVDGSVVPGMTSLEAGQSAFGDVYAWFWNLLLWSLVTSSEFTSTLEIERMKTNLIEQLFEAAATISPESSQILALDWLNGRRSPEANPYLKGGIVGLTLGTDAPKVFRGLIEATAFGSKKITERFKEAGILKSNEIIAIGGVAKKSPLVMQILADVLNMRIKVVNSDYACALGASMFASVIGGVYNNVLDAQKRMKSGFISYYDPIPKNVSVYQNSYKKYVKFGEFMKNY